MKANLSSDPISNFRAHVKRQPRTLEVTVTKPLGPMTLQKERTSVVHEAGDDGFKARENRDLHEVTFK